MLFPTRACLNQRRALVPCVGQTTSTNEWQQQSGGMILRRGSVVAAFLLCFLAKVCGLPLTSAVRMYFDCKCVCVALYVQGCANITCKHASCNIASSQPAASANNVGELLYIYIFLAHIMRSKFSIAFTALSPNRCQRDLDNSSCKSYRCTM